MVVLMVAYPAWGTIIAGSDGTQNTSAPGNFLFWNNIGYVPFGTSDVGGSGIYLGDGWVLTAAHVQGGSNGGYTFVIPKLNNGADAVFTPQFASQVRLQLPSTGAGSDLTLFRLQDDARLQTLPQIQFGVTPQIGTNVTVIGSGYSRLPDLHYWHLANPNQPDSTSWTDVTGLPSQDTAQRTGYVYAAQPNFGKRWGTNTTVAVPGNGPTFIFNNTELFATSFDSGITNESQLAPGDSGGGVFAGNRLVGLNLYKGDDSNSDNPSLGQPTNTAVFNNASFYANLYDYVNELVGITKLHPSIDGDANLDGIVDRADFDIMYSNLGTGTTWTQGDFNLDGKVDFLDFQKLELNFGAMSFSEAPRGLNAPLVGVPEPASVGILVMVGCARLLRRRRA